MKKSLLLCLLPGLTILAACGGGSDGSAGDGDGDGDGSTGDGDGDGDGDGPMGEASAWCNPDGTVEPLLTPDGLSEISTELGLTEAQKSAIERSLEYWQSGMETICGIDDPVERDEAIDNWNVEIVRSALVWGEEFQAEIQAAIEARDR